MSNMLGQNNLPYLEILHLLGPISSLMDLIYCNERDSVILVYGYDFFI